MKLGTSNLVSIILETVTDVSKNVTLVLAFCSVKEDCHWSRRQHCSQLEDSVLSSFDFFLPR